MGFSSKLIRWSTPFTGLFGRDSGQREVTYRSADPAGGSLYHFLNSLGDSVWIKNRDHRFVFASDAFVKSVRVAPEALIGATHEELLERWPHSALETRPEAIAAITAQDRKVMTENVAVEYLDEIGQSSDNPLWVHKRKAPLMDEHRNVIGMIAIAQDVTRAELAEREATQLSNELIQKLEETESMTKWAAKVAGVGWSQWLHQEERYKSVDEVYAGIHGFTVEEFMHLFETLEADHKLVHPEDQDAVMDYYETTDYTETSSQEYRIINRVGDIVHIREVSTPIDIRDGKIIESLSTIQDVTAFKLIEQNLEGHIGRASADREISERILRNVTHELLLPLTGVMSCVESLERPGLSANNMRQYALIEQSARRMEVVVGNLLKMSALNTSGPATIKSETFSISELVYQLVAESLVDAEDAGVTLKIDLNIDQDLAHGPHNELLMCLRKFLENAFKFAAHGEVIIRVSKAEYSEQATEYTFSVIDRGIGIAEDQVDRVYDAFYQVDSSISRKFEGAGLGLALVRLLVQSMGGEYGLTSELGKGSHFWFSVPLETAASGSQT